MSRGGRGGGRGRPARNKDAPSLEDLSDDGEPSFRQQKRPPPLFPDIDLPTPKPPTTHELSAVKHYLAFRKAVRNGPYFSTLDPSSVADEKTGKPQKRAGFDPFNDQETYTSRSHAKKRAVPDLHAEGIQYSLSMFPPELWSTVDPERKSSLWKTHQFDFDIDTLDTQTPPQSSKSLKRKRPTALSSLTTSADDEDKVMKDANDEEEQDPPNAEDEDSDALVSSSRRIAASTKTGKKRRQKSRKSTSSREKRGLDAEDDFTPTKKKKGPSPPQSLRAKEKRRKMQEIGRPVGEAGEKSSSEDEDVDEHTAEDGEGGGEDEDDSDDDEPVDSEFEESDEGDADDYNAEKYFDDAEGDDDDDGFGGAGGDDGGEF